MKPIITIDLDNTALNTGKGLVPPNQRTYEEFRFRCKGYMPGIEKLCALYRVYFLSARSFPGAYELSYEQTWELPCVGLLTNVEYFNKEQVSINLGALAHIDDDWRVRDTAHTFLVNVWDECPKGIPRYESLTDPELIKKIESRRGWYDGRTKETRILSKLEG